MKARNLGRLELLAWINEVTECDYPKVELCSDSIGYCQVLDAIHPAAGVPLHRLNFNARNKDDFARNLKILDDVL
jgi:microtubule-associated protein, RP/EB family